MAKLTALRFVAPVSTVVDSIAHPEVWLAEPVLTCKLVLLTLCRADEKTDDKEETSGRLQKQLPYSTSHSEHAVKIENKCQEAHYAAPRGAWRCHACDPELKCAAKL